MDQKNKIKGLLKKIPPSPGIYKMYSTEDTIIYIGKAKNLKKRVSQYFQKTEKSIKTQKLIENTTDIKYTVVDSELEALILETNLIKKFKPKYNILMKDDKNYVYIKITKEDFPRIKIVRKMENDQAYYIGPKTSAHNTKEIILMLKKLFPFRHCDLNIKEDKAEIIISNKTIKYPCLDYYIKKCSAPCIKNINKAEYNKIINNVKNFLNGKHEEFLRSLKKEMEVYAQIHEFEKAAKTRDKIKKIEEITEKQKVSNPNVKNTDILNYTIIKNSAYFNVFEIREGKLIGQENFTLKAEKSIEKNKKETLESFIKQYYQIKQNIPKELIIPHKITNQKNIETILQTKIIIPQKGDKNKLIEMSLKNAKIYADRNRTNWEEKSEENLKTVKKLQSVLRMKIKPKRIEGFDISHLSGTQTVGSMVVFENGTPQKSMYRKFKLRTIKNKPDDYKSMEEVLFRRLIKLTNKGHCPNCKIKKAGKKHVKYIGKNKKEEIKNFYIIEKNKKSIGYIEIKEHSDKIAEIRKTHFENEAKTDKLHFLLKIIEKIKQKRVYILCEKENTEELNKIGFEIIKKIPDAIKAIKEKTPLVFDKNKHKKDISFEKTPDLIIIDGGKGQLNIAKKVIKKLKLKIEYMALAKKMEYIYTPHQKDPIILEKNSETLKLLQRIRNEAHRFAITFNRERRIKNMTGAN